MILQTEVGRLLTEMATVSPMHSKSDFCPQCSKKGILSNLKICQINFDEALYLCSNENCEFPTLSENLESYIIKRSSTFVLKHENYEEKYEPEKFNSSQKFEDENSNISGLDFEIENMFSDQISDNFSEQFLNEILGLTENNNEEINFNTDKSEVQEHDDKSKQSATVNSNIKNIINKTSDTTVLNDTSILFSPDVGNDILPDVISQSDETLQQPQEEVDSVINDVFENEEPMDIDNYSNHCDNDQDSSIDCIVLSDNEIFTENELDEKLLNPIKNTEVFQWRNADNLCWLDVIMLLIANSVNLRACINLSSCSNIFKEICRTYDHCQKLHVSDQSKAMGKMLAIRSKIFKMLQFKSNLKKGEHESPVELLPNVLNLSHDLQNSCTSKVRWEFECEHCQHKRARHAEVTVVSLPNTNVDFHPLNAEFTRPCFKCKAEEQTMSLHLEALPSCLFIHFQNGLPHSKFKVWDFVMESITYSVYAVIQYKTKPYNHFILWIRDYRANKWIQFDDLEAEVCHWQSKPPKIPKNEIHIMMWERQGISQADTATKTDLELLVNEEVCSAGRSIPKEVFEAHLSDETIDITQDISLNEANSDEFDYHNTIPDLQSSYRQGQEKEETNENVQQMQPIPGNTQYDPHNSSQLNFNTNLSKMVSIVPEQDGRTMVQVFAPANTSRVVIVTNPMSSNPNQLQPTGGNTFDVQFTPFNSVEQKPVSFSDLGKLRKNKISKYLDNTMSPYLPKRHFKLQGYKIKSETTKNPLLRKWSSSKTKK